MIPFLLLLAVGVGQQEAPIGKSAPVPLVYPTPSAYNVQPPDKPCDKRYEYEAATAPDKPGFVWKSVCAPIMHPLKESEYQEIMERLKKLESRHGESRTETR